MSFAYSADAVQFQSGGSYYLSTEGTSIVGGDLDVNGNLSVAGTSQLTGAVTCGANLVVATSVGAASIGATVGSLGSLTVGGGATALANSLLVNGNATAVSVTVGAGGINSAGSVVVGTVAAPASVTVNGSVGATAVGATTGSLGSLTVGGGATAPANSLLTNFPALFAAGIGSMGTGLVLGPNTNTVSQGHYYLGNLLVQWGNQTNAAGGGCILVFPIPYPAGVRPCVTSILDTTGYDQYQFSVCEALTNTGVNFQSFRPDQAYPHYGNEGPINMWHAYGPAA